MEADPGTFDLARIQGYQEVGVHRFSIGVQAFDEASSRLLYPEGSSQGMCVQGSHTEPCILELLLSQHAVQGRRRLSCLQPVHQTDLRGTPLTWVSLQELLKACGRSHTLQDVYKAVEAIQQAGVASWSLDLISGLPNLTPAAWEHCLREAISAQPDHISVYDLQVGIACHLDWALTVARLLSCAH